MKTSFTKRAASLCMMLSLCLFVAGSLMAQTAPSNDDVCNALDVPDDGIGLLIQVDTATVQANETDLELPLSTGCDPHTICDGGIDASVWFKFTAPASGAVNISLCGSDYDTQLALYAVGDCADFGTFVFLDASDDSPALVGGAVCGPGTATPDYGLASDLTTECLTPGNVYYVLVDEWSGDGSSAGGVIDIKVTEVTPSSTGVAIDSIDTVAPLCPGAATGSATLVFTGVHPWTIVWSNGADTETIDGLTAGDYSATITDFCGTIATAMGTVPEAGTPEAVALGDIAKLDAYCHGGYINLEIVSGTPPFTIAWSTGESTEFIWADKGTYTVSVTDGCGLNTAVETIVVEGVADGGADVTLDPTSNCSATLGGAPSASGGVVTSTVTYNLDQNFSGGVACRAEDGSISDNGFYRTFDLASDFSIMTDYALDEIQIGIFSATAGGGAGFQPIECRIFEIDNINLATAVLTPVDTIRIDLPDTDSTLFSFPTDYVVPANQLFAIEIWNPNGTAVGNSLLVGVNESATLNSNPTWIRSEGCSIDTPTEFSGIGFYDEMIVNLIQYTSAYSGGYTFNWTPADGLDDATSANPSVTYDSLTMAPITTYTLAVTDDNGCISISEVVVDATTCAPDPVANVDIVTGTYSISPNPSNGLFNIQNEGIARKMNMEVFDIQGKLVNSQILKLAQGAVETLDISTMPKGMYILKMTSGNEAEVHKLIVQ